MAAQYIQPQLKNSLPTSYTSPTGGGGGATNNLGIPGLSNLTNLATNNTQNLLEGLPSTSWARTTNAYNGVASGQPATGGSGSFQENRGADIYHQQAQQNNQTGLQDLLSLIGGYSGTVAPSAGQQLSSAGQFAQLGQNNNQFNQNLNQRAFEWQNDPSNPMSSYFNNQNRQTLGANKYPAKPGDIGYINAQTGNYFPGSPGV